MRRKRLPRFTRFTKSAGFIGIVILGVVLGLQLLWWKWVSNPFDTEHGSVFKSLNPGHSPHLPLAADQAADNRESQAPALSSTSANPGAQGDSIDRGVAFTEQKDLLDPTATLGLEGSSARLKWQQLDRCKSIEFVGQGSKRKFIPGHWSSIQSEFLYSKALLAKWLHSRREELDDTQFNKMNYELSRLEIETPPYKTEPDLAWRGIIVLTTHQTPRSLRFGLGFAQLMQSDPLRARFEMVRAIAKIWAPCALSPVGGSVLWQSLLHCLEISSPIACKEGSYSEHAWAVSTALAVALVPLACRVPAVSQVQRQSCLNPIVMTGSFKNKKTKTSLLESFNQHLPYLQEH